MGFISFMETVPKMEGHFAPQSPLCNAKKYPYTDIIVADETLSTRLKTLSAKLGVEHPMENSGTSTHSTGAKEKLAAMFKGKVNLVGRILKMFEEDCELLPEACDVEDLMKLL